MWLWSDKQGTMGEEWSISLDLLKSGSNKYKSWMRKEEIFNWTREKKVLDYNPNQCINSTEARNSGTFLGKFQQFCMLGNQPASGKNDI